MLKTLLTTAVVFWGIQTWSHNHHTPSPLKAHLVYKNKTLHIHTQLNEMPKVGVEAFLSLETRQGSDHSLTTISDTIEVELWMPEMSHGSAPTQVTRPLDAQGNAIAGQYVVRNLYFVMAGTWEVRVSLIDENGKKETQSLSITLAGEHQH